MNAERRTQHEAEAVADAVVSEVRIRSAGPYQIEAARIVDGSSILDFEPHFACDDLDTCRARLASLRRESGHDLVAVIWDVGEGREIE